MKNMLFTLSLALTILPLSAQWVKKLVLPPQQSLNFISAVSDKVIWGLNNNKQVYISTNSGNTWRKINPTGIANNTSVREFLAVNDAVAFLAVNTDFTGVGPGIIYGTKDTGRSWQVVFNHEGNCEFNIAMYNNRAGLMTCSFNSFDGSIEPGQQLYKTIDGGRTWTTNGINDPSKDFRLLGLEIKNKNAWIIDGSRIYNSTDGAITWISQPLPKKDAYYNNLQVESNRYAIVNESSLINLFVKRPPANQWKTLGDPTGFSGALTCMVLDSSECWFATPFDLQQNYYSSDSARTFTPVLVDSFGSFNVLTKSWHGKNFWGVVFGSGTLWMFDRTTSQFVGTMNKTTEIVQRKIASHY